jgi:dTDP-4-dehydrorhamnose 3,5-epimerase
MTVEETYLKGCFVLTPTIYRDNRGLFFESYHQQEFERLIGRKIDFVQDNHSVSNKGVLRGLHYQKGDFAQAKLIRVIKGSVLDVCVDIRPASETFGKHFSIVLDRIDNKQLFIPRGFAHGFLALEDDTVFNYKCDNYYNKESEAGIRYDDTELKIDWNFPLNNLILSEKDLRLPTLDRVFK